jgi:hypothetical protein
MSGLECLADLITNDDGVSACDTGYVCFLCVSTVKSLMGDAMTPSGLLPQLSKEARIR